MKYRIELTLDEFRRLDMLADYLEELIEEKREWFDDKDPEAVALLLAKLRTAKPIKTGKKPEGAAKARAALQKKTREKVINAVNLLKMEGKEVTPYRVAETAKISYQTAKKYLTELDL